MGINPVSGLSPVIYTTNIVSPSCLKKPGTDPVSGEGTSADGWLMTFKNLTAHFVGEVVGPSSTFVYDLVARLGVFNVTDGTVTYTSPETQLVTYAQGAVDFAFSDGPLPNPDGNTGWGAYNVPDGPQTITGAVEFTWDVDITGFNDDSLLAMLLEFTFYASDDSFVGILDVRSDSFPFISSPLTVAFGPLFVPFRVGPVVYPFQMLVAAGVYSASGSGPPSSTDQGFILTTNPTSAYCDNEGTVVPPTGGTVETLMIGEPSNTPERVFTDLTGLGPVSPSTTAGTTNAILWVPELNLWILGSNNDTTDGQSCIWVSSNGADWTAIASPFDGPTVNNACLGLAWSPTLKMIVAVGFGAAASPEPIICTSSDGLTWTRQITPFTFHPGAIVNGVVWSPGLSVFVITGNTGSNIAGASSASSSNGVDWSVNPTPLDPDSVNPNIVNSICWSEQLQLFLIGGSVFDTADWPLPQLATSPDGVTWTARHSPLDDNSGDPSFTDHLVTSVCWSPTLGLFVACDNLATFSSGSHIYTSADGVNWTLRYSGPNDQFRVEQCIWWPALKTFIAVGSSGGAISTDGISWQSAAISGNSLGVGRALRPAPSG